MRYDLNLYIPLYTYLIITLTFITFILHLESQCQDLFNVIAGINRIPYDGTNIQGKIPNIVNPKHVPLTTFLPSGNDIAVIKSEFKWLIGKVLARLDHRLGWFSKYLPQFIHHKYLHITREKSSVVSI